MEGHNYDGTNQKTGRYQLECSGGIFPNIGSTGSDAGRYQGATAEKAVPFPSVACRSKAFQKRRVFPTYARNTGTPCRCSPAAAAHGAISLGSHPRMPTHRPPPITVIETHGPSRFPARVKYGVDSIEVWRAIRRGVSRRILSPQRYTSRLRSTAAPMKEEKSGCGSNGRDLSSGWNCTPMNQG